MKAEGCEKPAHRLKLVVRDQQGIADARVVGDQSPERASPPAIDGRDEPIAGGSATDVQPRGLEDHVRDQFLLRITAAPGTSEDLRMTG